MISVLSESKNFYFSFVYSEDGNCCGFTKNKISNFSALIDLKSLPTFWLQQELMEWQCVSVRQFWELNLRTAFNSDLQKLLCQLYLMLKA